ncbi:HEAT repeat domain-containing protein [uncultured Gimesia sp.]|uniref:HEAT repeat domain-containing protein n=1 Tax=uncultured Gimesia sp. TaxID=1678688 RepID=UPI0030D6E49F|tara:strand:- start:138463 stop:138810 length:348 start_codon:yes stop_codon:yes gene_type:complete
MDQSEFKKFVQQLRSGDSLTYEEGYHSIKGRVGEVITELLALAQAETEEQMRSRLVELIGESIEPEAIEFLKHELDSPFYEVRSWAYSSLCYSESQTANEIAANFKDKNPDEAFL